SADYSVGHATAFSPLGPYPKYGEDPVLSRGAWAAELSGPGHHTVGPSPDGCQMMMVYHIHADPAAGDAQSDRTPRRGRPIGSRPFGSEKAVKSASAASWTFAA